MSDDKSPDSKKNPTTDPLQPSRVPTFIHESGEPITDPDNHIIIDGGNEQGYHDTSDLPLSEPVHRVGSFVHDDHTTSLGEHNIRLENVPYYVDFVEKYSFPKEAPAHALMNYALQLGYILEHPDLANAELLQKSNMNTDGVLKTNALIYNVQPSEMVKYWQDVDRMIQTLGLRPIPDLPQYRHTTINSAKLDAAVMGLLNEMTARKKSS